jgi:hypothetical protein
VEGYFPSLGVSREKNPLCRRNPVNPATPSMRKWGYFAGGLILWCILAMGGDMFRMHPNSPMKQFKIPMFDKKGTKIWQCFG